MSTLAAKYMYCEVQYLMTEMILLLRLLLLHLILLAYIIITILNSRYYLAKSSLISIGFCR